MLYHALINPCHLYFLWSTYQACPLTDQETYMDIPYQNACWVKVIGQDELVDIKKEKGYHHSTRKFAEYSICIFKNLRHLFLNFQW